MYATLALVPDLCPQETAAPALTEKRNSPFDSRRLVSAIFSAVLPGGGQFLQKRWGKGMILLLLFVALSLIYWPFRIPHGIVDVGAAVLVMIALVAFAVCDVAYTGKGGSARLSAWWLTLLLPVSAIAGTMHVSWQLRAFGLRSFSTPTGSMAPTIPEGSLVIVDEWSYHTRSPQRGDIIVCNTSREPGVVLVQPVAVIKRVIAVGGEQIEVRKNTVLINGRQIDEPYAVPIQSSIPEMEHVGPLTIPRGKLFVMGDNREKSLDSRMMDLFGLVDLGSVRGKVIDIEPGFMSGRIPRD